jgi:two-component system, sensor histidine kinase PdtaS
MISKLAARLGPWGRAALPWAATAALVACAFLIRLPMQSALGGGLAYSAFYPAVILSAYAFGRTPAIAAAAASAALGYWVFVEPAFAWKAAPNVFAGFLFFTVTCTVIIALITGLTGALKDVSRELGRAQAVADSHAGLFRELNERMSHHMRLVAGVLALQAKGEPEPQVADSLKRAMERSLMISRVHRELGGRGEEAVAFDGFAASLARAVCTARDQPAERVTVEPSGLKLDVEEATSLGVALAECLSALFDVGVTGTLVIRLDARGRQAEVAISQGGDGTESALVSVTNGYLLRAMTEQLGAAVALRADAAGSALVLSIPRATAAASGTAATLH